MTGFGHSLFWQLAGLTLHLSGAVAAATVTIWLWSRRDRFGSAGTLVVLALLSTVIWSLVKAGGFSHAVSALAETGRNIFWLAALYRLFAADGRHTSIAAIRPVVFSLLFVEMLNLGLIALMARANVEPQLSAIAINSHVMFRLLVAVGALMLVHNLYAGASAQARTFLRWPASGIAILWIFDLNLYTLAYLGSGWPEEMEAMRGLAVVIVALLFGIAATEGRDALRFRPSRTVTFQTFSLLLIGIYLAVMLGIAQWLSYAGGDFARMIAIGFLTIASVATLLLLPSKRLRASMKVLLTKHLFQHRYDYREEWLRFTRTIGHGGEEAAPLAERAVKAVADISECPAGLLLAPGEDGDLTLAARWNWPEIEVPGNAMPMNSALFFERENYIADLDDVRRGRSGKAPRSLIPEWLTDHPRAWVLVPLIHYERLVGIIVLARPEFARKLDWEDFDLLRVVGQQLASYLAESVSEAALAEANRFEDFHRRIAFVMHDIKNLASQMSLLARNAELHAEKKAFRDDMLVTLRNSADKLNALLARLSRYGNGVVESLGEVSADTVARTAIARFGGSPQVVLTQCEKPAILANADALEQVLVHLIQNAIDASPDGAPVFLSVVGEGLYARFDVIDSGRGMSPEFTRSKLFKPFVSTKSGGFGIGAFEARELVRAMRGRLDVESREGLGSRFTIRIPVAAAAEIYESVSSNERKLAS